MLDNLRNVIDGYRSKEIRLRNDYDELLGKGFIRKFLIYLQ